MESTPYPKAFSHIGLTVPDLEHAVTFYHEVMGWYIIVPPTTMTANKETEVGRICIDVFGKDWDTFRIAHLSTADGIGFELFEFPQNTEPQAKFQPYRTGLFHFCVKDPDIETLAKKIVAAGGKQRMPIHEYYSSSSLRKMVYMEDPFGNIIEIYTHSYELQVT